MCKPFSVSRVCLSTVLALFLVSLPTTLRAQDKADDDLPDGPGKAVVVKRCGRCHSLKHIPNAGRQTRDFWHGTVEEMYLEAGWEEDEDFEVIVDYLAKQFGPAEEKGASAPVLAPCAVVHTPTSVAASVFVRSRSLEVRSHELMVAAHEGDQ